MATISPTTVVETAVEISLTDQPSLEQVKIWWADLQQDPVRNQVYTDRMPRELDDFLAAISQGQITLWMFLVRTPTQTEVGGAFYFHDSGIDHGGPYTWLGTYVRQPYRRYTLSAWAMLRQLCEQQGMHRIFVATCHANRPAQIILSRAGFTKLGRYVDWGYFGGKLQTVLLYTLQPEDQATAWVAAEQRARRLRQRLPQVCA
ncbi:MAG TPA: GNAT family protein [Candidatus Tectomicrobia bacterium]|jgi:RimJ/RimL family protein N-acetyltransferase